MRDEDCRAATGAPGSGRGHPARPGKTLSILWVFATVSYTYCDVLALMDHDYLRQVLTGSVGGVDMTPGLLTGFPVRMKRPGVATGDSPYPGPVDCGTS